MRSATILLAVFACILSLAQPAAAHDTSAARTAAVAPTPLPEFDYTPPAPGSYALPRIKPAGGGTVLDADGQQLDLRNLQEGKLTVLSFIYTRCGDVCPTATLFLHDLHTEMQKDERLDEAVQLISLSIDPAYDTPDVMATYATAMGVEAVPSWRFLTTSGQEEIAPLLADYGQSVMRKADPDDVFGPIAHQLRLYVIDREGWVRNIYSLDYMDLRLVIADLQTLLIEEGGDGAGG